MAGRYKRPPTPAERERREQAAADKLTALHDRLAEQVAALLPEPPRPQLLTGQAPPGLWDALARLAADRRFTLERGDCGRANGWTDYTARTVRVRGDVDDAQAVKTLAHELGHVLLHDPTDFAAAAPSSPGVPSTATGCGHR